MLKNYIKIAIRQLLRNKTFSIINILGLAVGMASVILIMMWINSEVSYDRFHSKKERIYELWNRGEYSGELHCWNTTPKVAAKVILKDIPEVEKVARVDWSMTKQMSYGEKKLTLLGNAVDEELLDIFDFPLIKGSKTGVLTDNKSILLTQSAARKIFGEEDPIGKTLIVSNREPVVVKGILADPPDNTRFDFEYLLHWSFLKHGSEEENNWGSNSTRNYILLKENANIEKAQEKIKDIRKKYQEPREAMEMFLYPLERWRLYSQFENGAESGGRIEYVRLFGIIAGFILLIACINFMNLSTARSEKRAREVGIRKTVGAARPLLVRQFLIESTLLAFLGFLLSLVLVHLSMSWFNEVTWKRLSLDYSNIKFWLASIAFIVVTGLLAGSYPAFFLSSLQPVKVLKGVFKSGGTLITPRKVMVVLQFTFAIVLIICTVIVKQQITHVQERQTGYDKDKLVYIYLTGDLQKNYPILKKELLQQNIASRVCLTSSPLTDGWSDSWGFEWRGKDPNDKTTFDRYGNDEEIVSTAGLSLVKGRDFNLRDFPSDSSGIILNESAVKVMKLSQPIGEMIKDGEAQYHVIGVVRDFILHSPYYPTRPMIILGAKSGWLNVIHIKLSSQGLMADKLEGLEKLYKKYNPGFLFEYSFISDDYESKFKAEKRVSALANMFTVLTILISCLGLFGLSTHMAENRYKEIGIRKVLGASVFSITRLLSVNFLKLVLISFVIATPFAWWFMHNWLKDYPYKVDIKWWVFAAAGMAALLISIFTVSLQSLKAALANPINSLRTE